MRANAFGARGDLSASGTAFRAGGEMILDGGVFCAGDLLIEIRAELSIIQVHSYPSFRR